MTDTNTMTDLIHAVTQASAQNDRWLFIGTLFVLGLFAMGVMRYFVKQHERLIEDHRISRDKIQSVIENIVKAQNETALEMTRVLTQNSDAMKQNSEVIMDCTEVMKDCSAELRLCREK